MRIEYGNRALEFWRYLVKEVVSFFILIKFVRLGGLYFFFKCLFFELKIN